MRRVTALAVVLVALAVVAGANYVLLGYGAGGNDRLGKLSPRGPAPAARVKSPIPIVPPADRNGERSDD